MHKPMKYNGYSVAASEQRCTCYVAGCLNDHDPRIQLSRDEARRLLERQQRQQECPRMNVTEVVGASMNPRAIRQLMALFRAAGYLRGIAEHGGELWKVRGREIVADLERLGLYDDPDEVPDGYFDAIAAKIKNAPPLEEDPGEDPEPIL